MLVCVSADGLGNIKALFSEPTPRISYISFRMVAQA
jgi:hypothetical protein